MRRSSLLSLIVPLSLPMSLLSACLDEGAEKPTAGTGARLSVDYFGQSDVVGFHFELERVACDPAEAFRPERRAFTVDLVDGIFPGEVELIAQTYDEQTQHLGADLFTALAPGCYDLIAAPASAVRGADWTPSADCSTARADGLRVIDGRTTEATLISQCEGDESGALDTLVTLNHAPDLVLRFADEDRDGDGIVNDADPDQLGECTPVEVCATLVDANDDAVELVWARSGAAREHSFRAGPMRVIGYEDGHRIWEQCATLVNRSSGASVLSATAFDLGRRGGQTVRMEALLAELSGGGQSRDLEQLSLQTRFETEPLCYSREGVLGPRPGVVNPRVAGCTPTDPEDYFCGGGEPDPVLVDQLCEGGALKQHSLYGDCEEDAAPHIETLPGKRPALPDLSGIVADDDMLILLGKALFWDIQVGSDGVACASCHYAGGGDIRLKNAVNPGPDGRFGGSPAGHPVAGPNERLTASDFPFYLLSDIEDRSSTVRREADDRASSEGAFGSAFLGVQAGEPMDVCRPRTGGHFFLGGLPLRQVEPRNSPTVVNAVFNFRNFWDGRANNVFNGVDPFGRRTNRADPRAGVLVTDSSVIDPSTGLPRWRVSKQQLELRNASLASQAVGPPGSDFEMSCAGRSFPEIGRKLVGSYALEFQRIDVSDSVFGAEPRLLAPDGDGLVATYGELIEEAFEPRYWQAEGRYRVAADGRIVDDPVAGYTQRELNMSLFFGLAVQAYEATLISDQTPFDDGTLDAAEARGLAAFVGKGKCVSCHNGPLLSAAAWSPDSPSTSTFKLIERMVMGDGATAMYDHGFYNIAVRPTAEDVGLGGLDPYGGPLSFTRQWVDWRLRGVSPVDPGVTGEDPCSWEERFSSTGGCLPGSDVRSIRVAVDGAFKTPTLRNVGLNAPYFHNGGTRDLRGVVEFYNRGGDRRGDARRGDTTGFGGEKSNLDADITRLGLTDREIDDMVAFMLALTDDRVACHAAPFDHPELPLTEGSSVRDVDPADGLADDLLRVLPAVGERGLPALGRPCQPNTGDLFGDTQAAFDRITE